MYTGIRTFPVSVSGEKSDGSRPSLAWNDSFIDAPTTSAWQKTARTSATEPSSPVGAILHAASTAFLTTDASRLYGSHSAFLHTVGLEMIFTRLGFAAARGVSACTSPPAVT